MRRTLVLIVLLSAACAEAPDAPAAAPATPREMTARGTEPFWAVEIRPAGLTLMRPDQADLVQPNPGAGTEGKAVVWKTPAYRLSIEVEACSDGMSDLAYPFSAELVLADGGVLKGCAGKGQGTS